MKEKFNPIAGLIVVLFCAVNSVNSYSKYGRGCGDIGCLPNEMCVVSYDSCSFGQRDGKDCGSYPTCKKNPNGGSVKPPGASLNPAPDNTIFSPSSNPSNAYNPNNNNANNNNNNRMKPQSIDGHYVFGSPNVAPINPHNMPIFPFNSPTNPPAFQQFPQPNHPSSGSGGFNLNPHNIQPQNPYNPPFVFGQQPFFNPQGTGGPPNGGFAGGYQNPNMFNKPPQYLPNQNPYNRQTQPHPSSAVRGLTNFNVIVACVLVSLVSMRWRAIISQSFCT